MIAYHFPPVRVSSGIQRTLKFTRYLLDYNWRAQVLTVVPKAYSEINGGQLKEIPEKIYVKRAFALDTSRHLSIKGRYLEWMALPDRWVSWFLSGLMSGILITVKFRPKVIWSTYPIATAHLIGLAVHQLTGIPWVADFRDSMTESDYPVNLTQRKVYLWIERQTIKYCLRAVFTTPSAIKMYKERYPEIEDTRWVLIPNGYDEENFVKAEQSKAYKQAIENKNTNKITLLHSGVLYPSERDPSQFFQAMSDLVNNGAINSTNLKIILRATGHNLHYKELIKQKGLQEIVFIETSVSYENALAEMLVADGLLIFQASSCNHQIPAKIYEYLRAKKPILALTDLKGDTAAVLTKAGTPPMIAALDNKEEIIEKITLFLQQISQCKVPPIPDEYIFSHSREARTKLLANVLNEVCNENLVDK